MATAVSTTPTTLDSGTAYEVFVLNSGAVNVIVTVGALQQKRLRPGQSANYFTGGQAVTAVTESGSGQVDVTTSTNPEGGGGGGGGSGAYAPISATWATGTVYKTGELVTNGTSLYKAVDNHTAGATFAGDSAHWTQVGGAATAATTTFTPAGNIAATNVQSALAELDSEKTTAAAAATAAGALDSYQRLISYYGKDENGLPNKPWRQSDPVGPELWALANFTAGGAGSSPTPTGTANTSTLSPSASQAVGNVTLSTRVLIPSDSNTDGGESTYTGLFRLTFDITSTTTAGWEIQVQPRSGVGAATITYVTPAKGGEFSVQPTSRRVQYEFDAAPIGGSRVRYFDVQIYVPGTGTPSGSVSITNVSLRNINRVLPYLRVSWDRTVPSTSAKLLVHMPVGLDLAGNQRWVREEFGPDNGSTLVPTLAVGYPEAAMQSFRLADSSYFTQYAMGDLHLANSADVITVFKTATTSELRGNTHGGEAGRSGTFLTDNVVHVDYGDGTWVALGQYDRSFHSARRVRIVTQSKLTRSDQGSPFAHIDRTYIVYNDGTIRCDKSVTFQQNQQISKWFWHMTSQSVPGAMYEGKLGQGQRVIGSVDYMAKLAVPSLSSAAPSTTGGTIPASATGLPWSVRVTAMNQFGETVPNNHTSLSITTTGATSSIAVAWGAVSGATHYGIYFGPRGSETRIAVTTGTSYTVLGSETPTGLRPPRQNTAYTGAQAAAVVASSDVADWSAVREKMTGTVYSLSLDRLATASMGNGVSGVQAQLAAVAGSITKNYWPLTFNDPSPTIPNGAVFTGTQWVFFYQPASDDFEREQTYRAASVADLPSTLYPAT